MKNRRALIYLTAMMTLSSVAYENPAFAQTPRENVAAAEEIINSDNPDSDIEQAVNLLFLAVDAGDPKAMFLLGQLYYEGEQVDKDTDLGLNLLRESSSLKYERATRYYSRVLIKEGLIEEAVEFLSALSTEGSQLADFELAKLYFDDEADYYNIDKAKSYIDKILSAVGGIENAEPHIQDFTARILVRKLNNGGISADLIPEKVAELEQLADLGSWQASNALSKIYIRGLHSIPADPVKGYGYLISAVDRKIQPAYLPLGRAYISGRDIEKNVAKGVSLLEKADEFGDPFARLILAEMAIKGEYSGYELDKARDILVADIEKNGNSRTSLLLSRAYANGVFGEKNAELALKYSQLAAENENPNAKLAYARQLLTLSDEEDAAQAITLLTELADEGNVTAARTLVQIYGKGEIVTKDMQSAEKYLNILTNSNDQGGLLFAARALIRGEMVSQDVVRGVSYITRLFSEGYDEAVLPYADLLLKGEHVEKDEQQAVTILEEAASDGNKAAQLKLGQIYLRRDQQYTDLSKGIKILEQTLADAPTANNASRVARAYLNGSGIERDQEKGIRYLKLAAELGHPTSNRMLGDMYSRGRGVPKNFSVALKYAEAAIAAGDERAQITKGDILLRTRRNNDAIRAFEEAASNGNPVGNIRKAQAYLRVKQFPGKLQEGLSILKNLSTEGNADASLVLANLYRRGTKEIPASNELALSYYDAAINAGSETAAGNRLIVLSGINNKPEQRESLETLYQELSDNAKKTYVLSGFSQVEIQIAYLVQKKLQSLGLYKGPLDGLFGVGSNAAMRSFCLKDAANGPCRTPPWDARNALRVLTFQEGE